MTLTVWNPFREMEELLDRYSRSAKKSMAISNDGNFQTGDWIPMVDIEEAEDNFIVKAELPGVEKNDVAITIENGILTIKGEKKAEKKDKKNHRIECSYGSFIRSFSLPQAINPDEVVAEYKNGILNLNIPKLEEAKPKKINVKIE